MANLFEEFKGFVKGVVPDEALLIPILVWSSGSEKNIEVCQRINRQLFNGNRKIYIRELTLYNNVRHIIRYPKIAKNDDKLQFFYDDLCSYFQWTRREFSKNINSLDLDELKPVIAKAFGYDNKLRKQLKLEALTHGKKTKRKNTSRDNGRKFR